MIILWLFLYLACLVRVAGIFSIDGRSASTLFLILPLLLLPLAIRLRAKRPQIFQGWPLRAAGILSLAASMGLAKLLNLDFWDTKRTAASLLVALMGVTFQWVMLARPEESEGPGVWLWIAFWEYAGAWHPTLPFLGLGLGAGLSAFGQFPKQPAREAPAHPMRVWPALLLLGMALPKPIWDSLLEPTWAQASSAFAIGAALTHLGSLRRLGARLSQAALLAALGLLFVLYPSSLAWLWALALGIFTGWIWIRLPRPLPLVSLSLAFLLGMILSFVLHANAGRPFLRHFIWLGGGSSKAFWFS